MHTIKLQIQDDIYDELVSQGIDLNHKVHEFLNTLVNDSYPPISTQEAKKRVTDGVDRYKSGKGSYLNSKEYELHSHNTILSLKQKLSR